MPADSAKPHAAQISALHERRRAAQAALECERQAVARLQSRLQHQREQLLRAHAERDQRLAEVRYRLGDALVRAVSHPGELPRLPWRLVQLLREGIRRRRARRRAPAAETTPLAAAQHSQPPRLPVRVAALLDDSMYACLRGECQLVRLATQDWPAVLAEQPPDFLLVQSGQTPASGSRELIDWCHERRIPTVFWNTEDPPDFRQFLETARCFDFIFTLDEECIPQYRKAVGHDRVLALPCAVQPAIHNPIQSKRRRAGNICLIGSYRDAEPPQPQPDLELLLRPATSRGLTILDPQRGHATGPAGRYPSHYAPFIRGGLSSTEMLAACKAFHVFLNVSSVPESPGQLRRVLEALACGTAVISTPAPGLERMLGDAVAVADSEREAESWMDRLTQDPELRERMVLRGQRRVFGEHTYAQRLHTILDHIGYPCTAPQGRVSVITVTNRPDCLQNAIENYVRQGYAERELILVLNDDTYDLADIRSRFRERGDVRVFQMPADRTLGQCLNFAVDQSDREHVAKFDDDDYYGEHYLTDTLNAFLYCAADIVGKRAYYAYLTNSRQLALRFPDLEHCFTDLVSGATLVVRRAVLDEQRFPEDVPRGVDTQFQHACLARGFQIYSADRFNFAATRSAGGGHTWGVPDKEFLEKCRLIGKPDDYRSYVSA